MKAAVSRMFTGLACVLALCAGTASANTYTIDIADTGWVNSDGSSNGSNPGNNYLVGNCGDCGTTAEYRDFFQFNTSGVTGKVTSADLRINLHEVQAQQSPLVNLILTSFAGTSFNQLGTGTLYGTFSASEADSNQWVDIALNSASFAAITSGSFGLSGRIAGLEQNSPLVQHLFGFSGGAPMQLLVATTPVPEPETWALLSLGAVGLIARRKRSKSSPGATA